MSALLWYLALGAAAGLLAGLLGVGGGLVIVATLVWLLPAQGIAEAQVMHVALATSLASIVLTGLSSAYAHHRRRGVLWRSVAWLVPGLLAGGLLGAAFATTLSPLLVGILVWGIGLSLGGPTGYAINPARDLGPRIAHAVLPISGKGDSDWGYSWIPVVAPVIGGILGGLLFNVTIK